jgi:tryptophan synthase alpha subunit
MWALYKALEGGVTLEKILDWVRRFRRSSDLPVVLMTYFNFVFH